MVLPVKTIGITSVFEERLRTMKEKDPDKSMSLFTKKDEEFKQEGKIWPKLCFLKTNIIKSSRTKGRTIFQKKRGIAISRYFSTEDITEPQGI